MTQLFLSSRHVREEVVPYCLCLLPFRLPERSIQEMELGVMRCSSFEKSVVCSR
jgi:hypothetical protein